jgi:hypothetical protein
MEARIVIYDGVVCRGVKPFSQRLVNELVKQGYELKKVEISKRPVKEDTKIIISLYFEKEVY